MENEFKFKQGFNHGYVMQKFKPNLIKEILNSALDANEPPDYILGLREGKLQYENEVARERIKTSIQQGGKGKEQDRQR
jgi:hypothetical protein